MVKKLLFLIPNLKHGGAEKVLVNLVNNLDSEKYDITVQTLFDVGIHKKALKSHIVYRSFFKREFRGNSYLFKCFSPEFWWKRIVKEEYDIAISYLEGPTSRIVSGCKNPRTKKVTWLHIELNTPELAAMGFKSIEEARKAYSEFDQVVAVSKNVTECFEKNLPFDKEISVLYNTNETERIQEMACESVEECVFTDKDGIKVCSVAKLMKTKGFDRLVKVHKRLLDEGLNHKVYVLGIGEEQKYLENEIEKNHLEDTFILLGFKENPYKYVAKCDFYVCSSRREGLSTAVTEALLVGTPVISTDCSGAKELLGENDEYGLVIENSEEGIYQGMKKLLSDSELLKYYKKQAKVRGGFFDREKTVKEVEKMLDRL